MDLTVGVFLFLKPAFKSLCKIENFNFPTCLFNLKKKLGIQWLNLFLKYQNDMIPPRIEIGTFCVLGRHVTYNTSEPNGGIMD